ncbi:MAG: thiolase domain-containing protein [Methanobacteriota archaeon]
MRDVFVIGVGQTKYGELWERSFRELITEAGLAAANDAGIHGDDIEAIFVGSMSAGRFVGQEHVGALVADEAGLASRHIPATRVEAADASGGVALRQGFLSVASGDKDLVVVGGVEKITDIGDTEATNVLATMADQEWEAFFGATFPALYALMARRHMHEFGTTSDQLAAVAVKNHRHGAMNPLAAYNFEVTREQVLGSPLVATPLRLFDGAAACDGASAVVLVSKERAHEFTDKLVRIAASSQASDAFALHDRASFTELAATKVAATQAYKPSGNEAKAMDLAEVHDCFTIAEILAIEDLGFFPKGQGGTAAEKGLTALKAKLPVNTSGGLKARGHPLGASGIAQAAEIVLQLRGEAGKRQVEGAEVGLCHNVGGSGATAVVHVLEVA